MNNEAGIAWARAIMGDQPNSPENGLTMISKLFKLQEKYPHGPKLHETDMRERDTWANMMLRHTKDKHTQEHKARTPKQESGCETRGDLSLLRAWEDTPKTKTPM